MMDRPLKIPFAPKPGATTLAALAALVVGCLLSVRAQELGNQTIITYGPSGKTDRTTATFAFAASAGASKFLCSLDGSAPQGCTSPITFGNLIDGKHRFAVQGFADDAPLPRADRVWSIDASAMTRIVSGPTGPVDSSVVVFEFESRRPDARFVCSLDGEPLVPCASPQTYAGLRNGMHMFQVASFDALGQADPKPALARFQVTVQKVDLCPGTPRGAAETYEGCSAVELVANPALVIEPALDRLERAGARVAPHEAYRQAAAALTQAGVVIRSAGEQLGQGDVCDAAASFQQAGVELDRADREMAAAVRARQAELPPDFPDESDATDSAIANARFHLEESLFVADTAGARAAQKVFDMVCSSVAGRLSTRGRVIATEDSQRFVRLDTGAGFAMANKATPTTPVRGLEVSVEGIQFQDGTAVATEVKGAIPGKEALALQCMALRVAPVQRVGGPYTLHRPDGYRGNAGFLLLEGGMALGAVETGCPGATSDGFALHYSMRIDVAELPTHTPLGTLASELEEGEAPVRLPVLIFDQGLVEIKTTVHRTRCHPQIPFSCSAPEEVQSDTYTAIVKPRGAYADVTYDRTVFGVTDNGVPNDFESATAVSFQLDVADVVDASFTAEGYAVEGLTSSRPAVQPIGLNQPFAVYEDDFVNPDLVWPGYYFALTGQPTPSALRWARITGMRNGFPMSYSARLPGLIRDRVAEGSESPSFILPAPPVFPSCDNPPPPSSDYTVSAVGDTFYKLPYSFLFRPGHGNMNIDDQAICHRHGESQAYALDLGAPFGTLLRAARGGRVVTVEEDQNSERLDTGVCGGNYMWIRHRDGTFAVYFHMPLNGVLVAEGQDVKRGQAVATVGSTGCSSGPHVHFGVHSIEGTQDGAIADGNSLRVRYQVISDLVTYSVYNSYIPRFGNFFLSSNFPP